MSASFSSPFPPSLSFVPRCATATISRSCWAARLRASSVIDLFCFVKHTVSSWIPFLRPIIHHLFHPWLGDALGSELLNECIRAQLRRHLWRRHGCRHSLSFDRLARVRVRSPPLQSDAAAENRILDQPSKGGCVAKRGGRSRFLDGRWKVVACDADEWMSEMQSAGGVRCFRGPGGEGCETTGCGGQTTEKEEGVKGI